MCCLVHSLVVALVCIPSITEPPSPGQCTAAGWAFPWGLRVRLYEVLLRALFDSLDQADYVPDKDRYLQLLEVREGEGTVGLRTARTCQEL